MNETITLELLKASGSFRDLYCNWREEMMSRLLESLAVPAHLVGGEMSQEDAFLAAIDANPNDFLPRLVYADWLDEQGRGELAEGMRVSAHLKRIPRNSGMRYPGYYNWCWVSTSGGDPYKDRRPPYPPLKTWEQSRHYIDIDPSLIPTNLSILINSSVAGTVRRANAHAAEVASAAILVFATAWNYLSPEERSGILSRYDRGLS